MHTSLLVQRSPNAAERYSNAVILSKWNVRFEDRWRSIEKSHANTYARASQYTSACEYHRSVSPNYRIHFPHSSFSSRMHVYVTTRAALEEVRRVRVFKRQCRYVSRNATGTSISFHGRETNVVLKGKDAVPGESRIWQASRTRAIAASIAGRDRETQRRSCIAHLFLGHRVTAGPFLSPRFRSFDSDDSSSAFCLRDVACSRSGPCGAIANAYVLAVDM